MASGLGTKPQWSKWEGSVRDWQQAMVLLRQALHGTTWCKLEYYRLARRWQLEMVSRARAEGK